MMRCGLRPPSTFHKRRSGKQILTVAKSQRPGFRSAEFHRFPAYGALGAIAWLEKVRHWQRWLAAAGSTPGKRPAGLALA
jgi:hypothetical protein